MVKTLPFYTEYFHFIITFSKTDYLIFLTLPIILDIELYILERDLDRFRHMCEYQVYVKTVAIIVFEEKQGA